jgi:prevent-host-death family protein
MVLLNRKGVKGLWEKGRLAVGEEVVAISKFKATCLAVLDRVKRTGRPVLVTRRGEPIATIAPPPETKRSAPWLGSFKLSGKIVGDIVSPALREGEWEVMK